MASSEEKDPNVSDRSDTSAKKKKKVEEISEQLNEHLHPPDNPFDFPTANPSRGATKLRPDLEQIVSVTFVVNLHKMWLKLRDGLKVGIDRSDHGTLQKALDNAETNAFNAFRVYVTARTEQERWERENNVIFGAYWSEANRSLQKEKDDGLRAKQITDQDIKMRIATLFPTDYQIQESRRAEVQATVDTLKELAIRWNSRCSTLQTMLSKLRT